MINYLPTISLVVCVSNLLYLSKVQTKFAPDQKGYYSYLTIGYDKKKLRLSPLIVTTYMVFNIKNI